MLWLGQTTSAIGDAMTGVALTFAVPGTSGSADVIGIRATLLTARGNLIATKLVVVLAPETRGMGPVGTATEAGDDELARTAPVATA